KNSYPDVDTQSHPVQVVSPFSISCLNEARKGSRSDLRNRIFRPITRRWGICFRSTQRYAVCGLTPRNLAASRTVNGRSSATVGLSLFGKAINCWIARCSPGVEFAVYVLPSDGICSLFEIGLC